jgi:hypothetical protein
MAALGTAPGATTQGGASVFWCGRDGSVVAASKAPGDPGWKLTPVWSSLGVRAVGTDDILLGELLAVGSDPGEARLLSSDMNSILTASFHNGSIDEESGWYWCNRCQNLTNGPYGPCAAGGEHDNTGSATYLLVRGAARRGPAQSGWRQCRRCRCVAYSLNPTCGPCAAGGDHDLRASSSYHVLLAPRRLVQGQRNWRWCRKCQCLAFNGNITPGTCAAGGEHDHSQSADYMMEEAIPLHIP